MEALRDKVVYQEVVKAKAGAEQARDWRPPLVLVKKERRTFFGPKKSKDGGYLAIAGQRRNEIVSAVWDKPLKRRLLLVF